jgi:hypothetical protein
MALTPTLPAQRCRAAINARLSNATNGFNSFLVAVLAGTSLAPFAIDFSDDSLNYLHGKYDIGSLFEDAEITLPAIAVYQGPTKSAGPRNGLIGSVFSGFVGFGLDVHLMSTEGQSQTQFDQMVSCCHDAIVNTFNVSGATDYGIRQLVWNNEVPMGQPTRVLDEDTGQYLSTLSFRLNFYAPV